MPSTSASPEIEKLIQLLAKLPGLGPRSARRAALHLIKKRTQLLEPLSAAMQVALDRVTVCGVCGNIDTADPCAICTDPRRDTGVIIVVEDVADLWALERATTMNAKFHVLGGVLSALDGIGPEDLNLTGLANRLDPSSDLPVREIVLALSGTIDGQTTAHYIGDMLAGTGVSITRLAHGVPVGGELDYLDEGTLTQALNARTAL